MKNNFFPSQDENRRKKELKSVALTFSGRYFQTAAIFEVRVSEREKKKFYVVKKSDFITSLHDGELNDNNEGIFSRGKKKS